MYWNDVRSNLYWNGPRVTRERHEKSPKPNAKTPRRNCLVWGFMCVVFVFGGYVYCGLGDLGISKNVSDSLIELVATGDIDA